MKRKTLLVLMYLLIGVSLVVCGRSQTDLDAEATQIAAEIFATQTAEAPPSTPTPTHTLTPTQSPTLMPTPTVEATEVNESESQARDTLLVKTPTPVPIPPSPTATLASIPPTATSPPVLPTATPRPSQNWELIADSAADFPGPIQDRKWWYFWSKGRNNFIWEDMAEMPNQCYHSPNDWTLEICRDQITVEERSRGDAALQWKAREGGTYRFEWDSTEVNGDTTLRFYKHLDFVGNQGPGTELPYSAVVEDVIQWELFFWVPQFDTHYQVRVYKLQEQGED